MSSDTVDEDARRSAAYEVELAMDQMLQKANTKFGGRYIFSGHKILTQPYQEIGGVIDYVGDLGEIEQRVGVDGFIKVNIPGSDIFGSSGAGVFKVLLDLKNALDANDGTAIQASMALIDEEMDRISAALGTVGTRMNLVESNLDQLHGIELSLAGKLSQIEDVDMAVEAAEYMANQEAYQAALEAASSTLELPNLLDYLQ
jgi:flagellar hook-associated protein 3 FlgL